MRFCTGCGNKLEENHRFCGACGIPIDPPKESDSATDNSSVSDSMNEQIDIKPQLDMKQQIEMFYDSDTVDRKTLYDDGMLVLSSRDLILYTSDEKDELKRIPISSIQSCGYSTIRRGLMIKRRMNEEDNFQTLLTQKHAELADIKSKKIHYEDLLRQTRVRIERQEIKEKISKIENSLYHLSTELKQLESDPTKIKLVQEKVADVQKEVFKLPKSFESTSDKTAREEYRIWEYVINRRITGISKIKLETLPYDAVVTINDRIFGTTPLTIDKPLIDDAILEGKYHVKIFKEGHNSVEFKITTDLGKGSFIEKIELSSKDEVDYQSDKQIEKLRDNVPDRSIDLSFYEIEREIEGQNEILLLTNDEFLEYYMKLNDKTIYDKIIDVKPDSKSAKILKNIQKRNLLKRACEILPDKEIENAIIRDQVMKMEYPKLKQFALDMSQSLGLQYSDTITYLSKIPVGLYDGEILILWKNIPRKLDDFSPITVKNSAIERFFVFGNSDKDSMNKINDYVTSKFGMNN